MNRTLMDIEQEISELREELAGKPAELEAAEKILRDTRKARELGTLKPAKADELITQTTAEIERNRERSQELRALIDAKTEAAAELGRQEAAERYQQGTRDMLALYDETQPLVIEARDVVKRLQELQDTIEQAGIRLSDYLGGFHGTNGHRQNLLVNHSGRFISGNLVAFPPELRTTLVHLVRALDYACTETEPA